MVSPLSAVGFASGKEYAFVLEKKWRKGEEKLKAALRLATAKC